MIVGVENAASDEFRGHLKQLHAMRRLDRIVVDECHVIITQADFRSVMDKLEFLRTLPVPLVLLTATLPPSMQAVLESSLHCPAPDVLRGPTYRPEIEYSVISINDSAGGIDGIDGMVADLVRDESQAFSPADRAIIYVQTRKLAEDLSTYLDGECGIPSCFYHADLEGDERTRAHERWRAGGTSVMVATSAFSLGVDYPHVRLVVHREPPKDLVEFAQESGRAGRDGGRAKSVVLVTEQGQRMEQGRRAVATTDRSWKEEELDKSKVAMAGYVQRRDGRSAICRREMLGSHLDGEGVCCLALPDAALCDVCTKAAPAAAMVSCPSGSADDDGDDDDDDGDDDDDDDGDDDDGDDDDDDDDDGDDAGASVEDAVALLWEEAQEQEQVQGGGTPAPLHPGAPVCVVAQTADMLQEDSHAFEIGLCQALVDVDDFSCVLCWLHRDGTQEKHRYDKCPFFLLIAYSV
jgi:hypothetical protein